MYINLKNNNVNETEKTISDKDKIKEMRLLYEFRVVNNQKKQQILFQVSAERWKINVMR